MLIGEELPGPWRQAGRELLRMLAGFGWTMGGVTMPLPPPDPREPPGPEEWWRVC
ncbi:hypothetical protein ACFP1Z_26835 [Streptomyces gamaensis]|uniref:Uncharacterized protein n=1 Tax=Streptomyces gamaensis TaxID=1763542 RepID=A0ABW0Z4P2_9ACTN